MCGRYQFSEADLQGMADIVEQLNEKFGYVSKPSGEVYPTNLAPVLTIDQSGNLTPQIYQWGFPKWDGKGVVINARAETAFDKKMFRDSLLSRRCVVLSSGLYEWQKNDPTKPKDKYLLRQPESTALFMAGIYNEFKNEDGTTQNAFVILTTDANQSVATIHNRMPVILQTNELKRWIDDSQSTDSFLRREEPQLVLQPA